MTHPLAALIAGVPRWSMIEGTSGTFMARATSGEYLHVSDILAALEAATPPDLVEAGKVLEGVSNGAWKVVRNRDKTLNVISGPDADGDTHKVCLVNGADEANARFIAWCREGVPALIALATAQAAQIAGLAEDQARKQSRIDTLHEALNAEEARAEAAERELRELKEKINGA